MMADGNMLVVGICAGLTIVSSIIWIFSARDIMSVWFPLGMVGTLFSLGIGLGVLCSLAPIGKDTIETFEPIGLARSPTTVFAKTLDGKTVESDSHAVYTAQDQDIRIEKNIGRNSYGFEMAQHTTTKLVVKNTNAITKVESITSTDTSLWNSACGATGLVVKAQK